VEPTASDEGILTEGIVHSQPWPTHTKNWCSRYNWQASSWQWSSETHQNDWQHRRRAVRTTHPIHTSCN